MAEVSSNITCKYCGAEAVVKFGTYKGVQRYWCKVCQRKFKADDSLFHMKTDAKQVSSGASQFVKRAIRAIVSEIPKITMHILKAFARKA